MVASKNPLNFSGGVKQNNTYWKCGAVVVVILLITASLWFFYYTKQSKLSAIPYFTYGIEKNSVRVNGVVYDIQFETKQGKVGYNGQKFKVCSNNKISLLINAENKLFDTPQKKPVQCCTFSDCSLNVASDMGCVIDWQNQESSCMQASMMRCVSDAGCPSEGAWVPDWSTMLAKKYYCKLSEGDLGFCTVGQEKPFECWAGEGCPMGLNCIDNFCEKQITW